MPLETIAAVGRFASERYFGTNHSRLVGVGRFGRLLLLVPYEEDDQSITPVTVHTITRQQMTWQLQEGRFQA